MSQENARKYLGMMRNNSMLLERLVNLLLEIAQSNTNQLILKTRPVEVISVIKECVFSFYPQAQSKNLSLSFFSPEETFFLYVDYDKFEIILNNLISNAIKFTNSEGRINIVAEKSAKKIKNEDSVLDCFEIRISDTGIGIPIDETDSIFNYSFRSDKIKNTVSGKGIGLAFTKELIELHHGKINVESILNKGSTFFVLLPAGKKHLVDSEIESEYLTLPEVHQNIISTSTDVSRPVTKNPAKSIILIVEDNAEMRFYLQTILCKKYQVITANNGNEGWEKVLKIMPGLIVSDIVMPDTNGINLCNKIKNDLRTNHIPVILLTAKAGMDNKIAGYESGADDYIIKPFKAEELIIRIRNILIQRKKLQEHFRHNLIMEPEQENLKSADELFIEKAKKIVERNISDYNFSVNQFALEMDFSRFHLNRKIQALCGLSTSRFVLDIKLRKAAQLLNSKKDNVSQIALYVGFDNFSYFSRCFKEKFGCSPSKYNKNTPD